MAKLVSVVVAGAVGMLAIAPATLATHARPKGGSPTRLSLVPAYEQCTSANRTHGPPLAYPSCSPPAPASHFVTVGTPSANGAAANSIGSVRITVVPHRCCPDQDVAVAGGISDVRCLPGTSTCGGANTAGGPDYTGDLQMSSTIRITDHNNATSPGGGADPATVVDVPFPVSMACAGTADPSTGGDCTVASSAVAVAGSSPSVPRAVVQFDQFDVIDGGADGWVPTGGNTRFAIQGVFIP